MFFSLAFGFILAVSSSVGKNYSNGGVDWEDPTCDPAINEIVSPIDIVTKSAICSTSFVLDIFIYKEKDKVFRFSFTGEPKVIRMKFPINSIDILVKFWNGRIIKYRARELIP